MARITQVVIHAFFDRNARFLDYGGGYGLMVRLLRDAGLDFRRYDKFCANLFAQGFDIDDEVCEVPTLALLTAFEVFEHLTQPLDEIAKMLKFSRHILFSTTLLPELTPQPGDWWYYGLEHGQHVALYTQKSLATIAERFQLNLYSDGHSLHLLTERRLSNYQFRLFLRQPFPATALFYPDSPEAFAACCGLFTDNGPISTLKDVIPMVAKILVSNTIDSPVQQRGVTRYFRHILEALIQRFDTAVTVVSPPHTPGFTNHGLTSPYFPGSSLLRVHDSFASLVARRQKAAVFYSPYYGHDWTQSARIYTIYDMIYERFPQHFPRSNWHIRRFIEEKRSCLERATLLLAISNATARDIIEHYPHIDPAKIVVTPLGVDSAFFEAPPSLLAQRVRPYFLFVGHRSLYKNFERALAAFGESGLASDFDFRVISPSGDSFAPREDEIIRTYQLQDRVHLVTDVTETVLRESYASATALIYPSEYEGFGLPILEAMASGTLVATSDVSSMPEVGGAAAFYFDPYSTDSIAWSLQQIATLSPPNRQRRLAEGLAYARSFSWARCQEQTVAAFLTCMEDGR